MKKGDIVREKRGNFVGLCVTNTLPSGNVVLTFYNVGELRTCIKNHNDIEVIEFTDGRINEALFPKNERAEEQRFQEEFYEPEAGNLVRRSNGIVNWAPVYIIPQGNGVDF